MIITLNVDLENGRTFSFSTGNLKEMKEFVSESLETIEEKIILPELGDRANNPYGDFIKKVGLENLIEAIKENNYEKRLKASKNFEYLFKKALLELKEDLKDKDCRVRLYSIDILESLVKQVMEIEPLLRETLSREGDWFEKKGAMSILKKLEKKS